MKAHPFCPDFKKDDGNDARRRRLTDEGEEHGDIVLH